jgi:anti-sigma factor RsiW
MRFSLFRRANRPLSCHQVAERLQAYLDDEIDDLTARRIAHHLEDCRRCGLELSVYTEIKQSLSSRGAPVDRSAVERLRAFGERLAEEGPAEEPGAGHSPGP